MRFSFFLGEALGSMRRNWVMAMAAIITVFISTAILGGVLVTRDNLNEGATSLENRVMIEVFMKDSAIAIRRSSNRCCRRSTTSRSTAPSGEELQLHQQGSGAEDLRPEVRRAHRLQPRH